MKLRFTTKDLNGELEFDPSELPTVVEALNSGTLTEIAPHSEPALPPQIVPPSRVKRGSLRGNPLRLKALAEFQAVHPLEESTWNRFAAELLSESTPANRTGRIAELRHYQRWLDENGGGSILDQDMDNLHLYLMSLDEGKRKYQSGTIRRFFAWLQGEKRPAYQSFRPNPLVKDPTRPSGRAANYRKRGPDKKPRRRSRRRNPNQRIGGVAAFSQQIATEFREQFPEESALFRRFIKHIYPNERRSHTPSARLSDLRQVQRILARANAGSILSYTPETAEKLITFLLSNGYRGSTLIVNRFLKYATEQGVLNSNPVIESAYE